MKRPWWWSWSFAQVAGLVLAGCAFLLGVIARAHRAERQAWARLDRREDRCQRACQPYPLAACVPLEDGEVAAVCRTPEGQLETWRLKE